MAILGHEVIQAMEEIAPSRLAMDKDPIGLQIGDPKSEVSGVMVTLDVTQEVVEEAIKKEANWIIAHHPIIYRPMKEVRVDQAYGKCIATLLSHQMNVYVAHTNLDVARGGVNDILSQRLGLENIAVFFPHIQEKLKKLVVFVPKSHHEKVLEALSTSGAGWIGNYSSCSFNTEGIGTFRPEEGTNPYIGSQGDIARVNEIRLETIVKEREQEKVVKAMIKAHPYEEVAYDVYPLDIKGETLGLGRVGYLEKPSTLQELAKKVKSAYNIQGSRVVGDLNQKVQKVAILGGSGGRFITEAIRHQADVYITGDVDYHVAQDAISQGLSIIDPGHHVEVLVVDEVCERLKTKLDIPILASTTNTNPFRFV